MRNRIGCLLGAAAVLAACDGGSVFTDTSVGGSGSGTISGQVRTATGSFRGARVVLVGVDSTTTDVNGAYLFQNLPSARYTLALRVPAGYALFAGDSAQRAVILTPGSNQATFNFTLQQSSTF